MICVLFWQLAILETTPQNQRKLSLGTKGFKAQGPPNFSEPRAPRRDKRVPGCRQDGPRGRDTTQVGTQMALDGFRTQGSLRDDLEMASNGRNMAQDGPEVAP